MLDVKEKYIILTDIFTEHIKVAEENYALRSIITDIAYKYNVSERTIIVDVLGKSESIYKNLVNGKYENMILPKQYQDFKSEYLENNNIQGKVISYIISTLKTEELTHEQINELSRQYNISKRCIYVDVLGFNPESFYLWRENEQANVLISKSKAFSKHKAWMISEIKTKVLMELVSDSIETTGSMFVNIEKMGQIVDKYGISLKVLIMDILNSTRQSYDECRLGRQMTLQLPKECNKLKEKYLVEHDIVNKLVKALIHNYKSETIDAQSFKELAAELNISEKFLYREVLGFNRTAFLQLCNGKSSQVQVYRSNNYILKKEEYLETMKVEILTQLLEKEFEESSTLTIRPETINTMCELYNVSHRTLLVDILGVSETVNSNFKTEKYDCIKLPETCTKKLHELLNEKKKQFENSYKQKLTTIKYQMTDIEDLSKKLKLHPKLVVRHILDKNEDTVYRFFNGEVKNIIYRSYDNEELANKIDEFTSENVIETKYTKEQLLEICEELHLEPETFVKYILGKKVQNYRQLLREETKFMTVDSSKGHIPNEVQKKRQEFVKNSRINHAYTREEIVKLCDELKIDPKLFVVQILGKKASTYTTLFNEKTDYVRTESNVSHIEDEIERKRSIFKEKFEVQRTKKYYSLEDIEVMSDELNMSPQMFVRYILGKDKNAYFRLLNGKAKTITYGEYEKKVMPDKYFEINSEEIIEKISIAANKAIKNFRIDSYMIRDMRDEIIQEVLFKVYQNANIYLPEYDKYMIEDNDIEMTDLHRAMISAYSYYQSMNCINHILDGIYKSKRVVDNTMGKSDDNSINEVTDNNLEEQIAKYIILTGDLEEVREKLIATGISEEVYDEAFNALKQRLAEENNIDMEADNMDM
ncbi:MAG TPA: hypothetical protein DCP90_00465 [Clostridiales bacterium]|nr:hypothetical protein [Clostridiales bacterium]